jgi:hypothetical protein
MLPLGEQSSDDRHGEKRRKIDEAAIQAFRGAGDLRAGEADAPAPAFELRGEEYDRSKADQGQCRPARRKVQEAVQRKAE